MTKVNEQRMKLRIEYSRETNLIFSDNIPAYADWLEKKLALSQPLAIGSLPYDCVGNNKACELPMNSCRHCASKGNDR